VTALLSNARRRLKLYDSLSKARNRYNPAAVKAYRRLATGRMPRNSSAWSAMHEALMKFDMHRQLRATTSPKGRTHAAALRLALTKQSPVLRNILSLRITSPSLRQRHTALARLFDQLSKRGAVVTGQRFPVGSTKALHFLNPELFFIIDKRVAKKLQLDTKTLPMSATAYTGHDYVCALKVIQKQIRRYGAARLQQLQPAQPLLRIVDKILFV
jgi:hypothetical protein